jgi:hypothetical protein
MSTAGRRKIKRKEIAEPENSNNNKRRARTTEETQTTREASEGNNIKYNNLFLF